MTLILTENPMVGSYDDDQMFAGEFSNGPDNHILGNSGDDFVIGDFGFLFYYDGIILGESIATAIDVDNPSLWNADENPLFEDSTIPHITWFSIAGEYLSLTAAAGATITLDVDYGSSTIGASSDTSVEIRDANGLLLASNDDSPITAGGLGSSSSLDAFLTFTAPTSSTYYIVFNSAHFGAMLNISVTGHGVGAPAPQGNDTIDGDDGDDQLFGVGGNDLILGGNGNDLIDGGSGADRLSGGPGNDLLLGGIGNDLIDGNEGADVMWGGAGDDTFYVEDGDTVYDLAGEGFDRVAALSSYSLAAGAEIEILEAVNGADTNALVLKGNEFFNTIIGNAGPNQLDGGGGDDHLFGQAGNDVLIGGPGADLLYGGGGDDIFYIVDSGDIAAETAGEGFDRAVFSASGALSNDSEVERLETIMPGATDPLSIAGSDTDNVIYGNSGANSLSGNRGDDRLYGLGGDDVLNGGAGNDVLIGEAGNDTMVGGPGDDTYYVTDIGDVVVEDVGGGHDRVATSVSYALSQYDFVEVLEAINQSATTAIDLKGSRFDNSLIGNDGPNVLLGGGGDDEYWGLGGDDTYLGADGKDRFYVQDAGDIIVDIIDGDNDVVIAFTNYVLTPGALVELIQPFDTSDFNTSALDLGGNEFHNSIRGTWGNNFLDGGGSHDTLYGLGGDDTLVGGTGGDTMFGGSGNDIYYVDDAFDDPIDSVGGGSDRVIASTGFSLTDFSEIEFIETSSPTATDPLDFVGSRYANTITGNAGANTLDGRGGNDVLTGLGGADTFSFTTALAGSPPNVDTIVDFLSGTDRIALDDGIFAAIAPGALTTGAFVIGSAAQDADDRIIYDPATGALLYDPDGIGAASQVQFATLAGAPALTGSDFVLI